MPNPFLDPTLVHGSLYDDPGRLHQRTSVLHAAKIAGADAADSIAGLVADHDGHPTTVADVGCGRGTTTRRLADRLAPGLLVAVDASAALLNVTAQRVPTVRCIVADFNALPLPSRACDAIVAAFCLYHSPRPGQALAELGRCLTRDGVAVLATKSADSYSELSAIVAASGLDPHAHRRSSLYSAFHSGNATDLARTVFDRVAVRHEKHAFRFDTYHQLARYLATTPRYQMSIGPEPIDIEAALHSWQPDHPVTMTSTVTYLIASSPR